MAASSTIILESNLNRQAFTNEITVYKKAFKTAMHRYNLIASKNITKNIKKLNKYFLNILIKISVII